MSLRRALALLLAFAAAPIQAQTEPVPIEQEPRHRLMFENEHVRYFDVRLEPGYEALYHWHRSDGLFVNIESSPTVAQDWGKAPAHRGGRAIGETYFIGYTASPKAHRVTNPGPTEYRVTDTEILKGCGPGFDGTEGPNQTVVTDNERVFVTRILLHPGESTELKAPCGMLVAVSDGSFDFDGSKVEMPKAGFKWRRQQATTKLTNAGGSVLHAVDIRLK